MKLKQTQFLKGSREFEIAEDTLFVSIKSFFKEEKLTVDLSTLNPEPVINESELTFYSDYKGRPVLSLLVNNPNAEKFNRFIVALKQGISGDDGTDAGIETEISESTRSEAMSRNVFEEPPEFAEHNKTREKTPFKPIYVENMKEDIASLKSYVGEDEIKSLLDSLETLVAEPQNEEAFNKMLIVFNDLGFYQGAVLTYAPYIKALVSNSFPDLERLGEDSYKGIKDT